MGVKTLSAHVVEVLGTGASDLADQVERGEYRYGCL